MIFCVFLQSNRLISLAIRFQWLQSSHNMKSQINTVLPIWSKYSQKQSIHNKLTLSFEMYIILCDKLIDSHKFDMINLLSLMTIALNATFSISNSNVQQHVLAREHQIVRCGALYFNGWKTNGISRKTSNDIYTSQRCFWCLKIAHKIA